MGENGTSQEKEGKRKRNEITLNREYAPTQSDWRVRRWMRIRVTLGRMTWV